MKTITLFSFIISLCMVQMAMAQEEPTIDSLLDRLHQNHMGSINDVFTPSEISILRQHFDGINGDQEPQLAMGDILIRTTENVNANLSSIDPADLSTVNIIAPSPLNEFEGAGAQIPNSAVSIVVDNGNNLYQVDRNGNYEFIGQLMPPAGQSFTGLEFTSDGRLFGIASDGTTTTTLYEINLISTTITPVGDTGLVVGIALGRDANNNLFSYDIDDDKVYAINKTTGAATELGPLGFDATFGQGMGFDALSGLLLITCFNNAVFDSQLRSVNTTTGATTLLGTIVNGVTLQFAWMSMFNSTLGVNSNSFDSITIYPNPGTDVLNIASELQVDQISIFNSVGQELRKEEINQVNPRLDISNLQTGLYFITIKSNEAEKTFRFMKN